MAVARPFDEVQGQVARLLKGRIMVGHDVKHDLAALELDHPHRAIRDTAKFSGFRKYGQGPKPALRVLAREILGLEIQDGTHSSIEDARVTMLLFRRHKPQFDIEFMSRFPESGSQPSKKDASAKKTTKKKKKKKN
ncbi:RNA exonuclease 4 [Magnaporthiopsis poae ATCC 64411]|uniref:RNA exonuclease 4 n=1 Tax=Magnaporthiopsis poae (strain ATCC 64411 / 73-15) TaxID=644358 RepID=A0A0C4DM68_MAGP6|nr:RNA exonuclease 4 [Magnaporthiopsis poae ATCC 64411]